MVHAWSKEVKAMAEMKGERTKELCRSRDGSGRAFSSFSLGLCRFYYFFFFLYTKSNHPYTFCANVFLSHHKVMVYQSGCFSDQEQTRSTTQRV